MTEIRKIFIRPGVYVEVGGNIVRYECQTRGVPNPGTFIVHDRLWQATCPGNGIICIRCFIGHLGRPLYTRELARVPANDVAFAMLGKLEYLR